MQGHKLRATTLIKDLCLHKQQVILYTKSCTYWELIMYQALCWVLHIHFCPIILMMLFNLFTMLSTHFTNQRKLPSKTRPKIWPPKENYLVTNIQEFKGLHNIDNFPPTRSHSWRRAYLRYLNCIETCWEYNNWGPGHLLSSFCKATLN